MGKKTLKTLVSLFIVFLIGRDINNLVKAAMSFDMKEWTSWLAVIIVSLFYLIFYPILIYFIYKKEQIDR